MSSNTSTGEANDTTLSVSFIASFPDPNQFDTFNDFLSSQTTEKSILMESIRKILFRHSTTRRRTNDDEQLKDVFISAMSEWMRKDFIPDYFDIYRKPRLNNARIFLGDSMATLHQRELSQDFPYLHFACVMKAPLHIINKLISLGGKDLVLQQEPLMRTTALYSSIGLDVKRRLIEVGGKELVMKTDITNDSALHFHIGLLIRVDDEDEDMEKEVPPITESDLEHLDMHIQLGGKELLIQKDLNQGVTVLHTACKDMHSSSRVLINQLICNLINVGGKDLVLTKDSDFGQTALHFFCEIPRFHSSDFEVMSLLIQVGGWHLLCTQCDNGYLPIHLCDETCFQFLLQKGVEYQVGGEMGIGGLFNSSLDIEQHDIYQDWNRSIRRRLLQHMDLIHDQPLLHAAIISKAPTYVLHDIINNFGNVFVTMEDSLNRNPVYLGIEMGLDWDKGLNLIVAAFSAMQRSPIIHVGVKFGLPWCNGMKEIVEDTVSNPVQQSLLYESENTTGLYPFMLSATPHMYDLDSIFELMKRSLDVFISIIEKD